MLFTPTDVKIKFNGISPTPFDLKHISGSMDCHTGRWIEPLMLLTLSGIEREFQD